MKSSFTIALFAILLSSTLAFESCVTFVGLNAFNLCPFSKESINFTVTTYTSETITFSIADNHITSCNGTQKVYATDKTSTGSCYDISQASPSSSLIDSSNATKGLKITYPAVNITANSAKQLVVTLKCNMNALSVNGTNFGTPSISSNGTTTIYTVTGESRYACPGSADSLVEFIKDNKTVFGTILIVLGSLFTFLGSKLVKFTIFTLATIIGFALSGMLIYSRVDVTTTKPIFWVLALLCIVLGLALGYLAHKLKRVAIFFVGAILGWVGGYVLYNAVLNSLLGNPQNSFTFLTSTQILCAIGFGILAFKFSEAVFVVSTSVVGSYMVASAIALFSGQFHSQNVINGDFEFGQYKYYYYVGMVILAGLGIYCQHKTKSKDQEELLKADNNTSYNTGEGSYAVLIAYY